MKMKLDEIVGKFKKGLITSIAAATLFTGITAPLNAADITINSAQAKQVFELQEKKTSDKDIVKQIVPNYKGNIKGVSVYSIDHDAEVDKDPNRYLIVDSVGRLVLRIKEGDAATATAKTEAPVKNTPPIKKESKSKKPATPKKPEFVGYTKLKLTGSQATELGNFLEKMDSGVRNEKIIKDDIPNYSSIEVLKVFKNNGAPDHGKVKYTPAGGTEQCRGFKGDLDRIIKTIVDKKNEITGANNLNVQKIYLVGSKTGNKPEDSVTFELGRYISNLKNSPIKSNYLDFDEIRLYTNAEGTSYRLTVKGIVGKDVEDDSRPINESSVVAQNIAKEILGAYKNLTQERPEMVGEDTQKISDEDKNFGYKYDSKEEFKKRHKKLLEEAQKNPKILGKSPSEYISEKKNSSEMIQARDELRQRIANAVRKVKVPSEMQKLYTQMETAANAQGHTHIGDIDKVPSEMRVHFERKKTAQRDIGAEVEKLHKRLTNRYDSGNYRQSGQTDLEYVATNNANQIIADKGGEKAALDYLTNVQRESRVPQSGIEKFGNAVGTVIYTVGEDFAKTAERLEYSAKVISHIGGSVDGKKVTPWMVAEAITNFAIGVYDPIRDGFPIAIGAPGTSVKLAGKAFESGRVAEGIGHLGDVYRNQYRPSDNNQIVRQDRPSGNGGFHDGIDSSTRGRFN